MELPQDHPKQPSDGFSGPPLARTEGVPDKGGRLKRLLRRPLFPSRLRQQKGVNQLISEKNQSSQATAASAPDPSEQVAAGNSDAGDPSYSLPRSCELRPSRWRTVRVSRWQRSPSNGNVPSSAGAN